jgi:hypothetical protein
MGQSRISINTDVRLHTKMPLISLLGLVHLRVARPIFVFRRAGGFDDRRIYDRTFFEQQSFGRQNGVDGGEDSLGEIVFFQQATELRFNQGKTNDLLRLNGPLGTFFIRECENMDFLLATGTGIAPIKAIL